MSKIRSKNTQIEVLFKKLTWRMGLRGYRVKTKILGKPDMYFPKRKLAVFIDGCFWHKCPEHFTRPKSKKSYWDSKIEKNTERDKETDKRLENIDIKVIRFWEHSIEKDPNKCYSILRSAYEKKDDI